MNVLSIQSHVCYGHAGNSAAVFPLQRLGHEVWPINTVQFSNHTGYGDWRGLVLPAAHLADLLMGIEERGVLPKCDAVLSGYLGDAASGAIILDATRRVKESNPKALYCCDPVMGDEGRGLFVRAGIPEFFAEKALPAADIATPNQFELETLTGGTATTLDDMIAKARALRDKGPGMVAVTSVRPPAVEDGQLGNLLATDEGVWIAETPLLQLDPPLNGTGDAFSALFLGHLLADRAPSEALARTVSALFGLLERTLAENSRELALIASQNLFTDPPPVARLKRVA